MLIVFCDSDFGVCGARMNDFICATMCENHVFHDSPEHPVTAFSRWKNSFAKSVLRVNHGFIKGDPKINIILKLINQELDKTKIMINVFFLRPPPEFRKPLWIGKMMNGQENFDFSGLESL